VAVGNKAKVEVGETVVVALKEETAEEISEAMEERKGCDTREVTEIVTLVGTTVP